MSLIFASLWIISAMAEPVPREASVVKDNLFVTEIAKGVTAGQFEKLKVERLKILDELMVPSKDPYTGNRVYPEKCRKEALPGEASGETAKERWVVRSLYSSKQKVLADCNGEVMRTQYVLMLCKATNKFIQSSTTTLKTRRGFLRRSCAVRREV